MTLILQCSSFNLYPSDASLRLGNREQNPPPLARSMTKRMRIAFWFCAVVAGFLQAWGGRFYIEPDGVNYLDIADAYLRHDWASAINDYWSPLYSWLLAGTKWLFHPSPYWESTALHLLNFALYLLALLAFEFFFRRLLSLLAERYPDAVAGEGFPGWAWWTLGYAAFFIVALRLIALSNDTPDMALASLLFLAAGLLIDIAMRPASTLRHVMLGIVLTIAYFTKSIMFPMSFVYLAAAVFARGGWKKPDPRALAGLAAFLFVSSPFVIALSRAKGHLTFGETGRIAYFNQVTPPLVSGPNKLLHLHNRLFENPTVYEYSSPFTSTYPPWHNESYWWEGAKFRFSLGNQLHAIARGITGYFRILSVEKEWIAGWLVLAFFAGAWSAHAKRWLALWFLWLPSAAMLALYSLVLVEPRYVAVAMAVVWLSLFAALPWDKISSLPRLGSAVALATVFISGAALVREVAPNFVACLRPPAHMQLLAAEQLKRLNLRAGDHVAVLGHTTVADYWAHLGGFTIAADVPLEEVQSYWRATPERRAEISTTLAHFGVKAIVSATALPIPDGWQPLGDSGYYAHLVQALGTTN